MKVFVLSWHAAKFWHDYMTVRRVVFAESDTIGGTVFKISDDDARLAEGCEVEYAISCGNNRSADQHIVTGEEKHLEYLQAILEHERFPFTRGCDDKGNLTLVILERHRQEIHLALFAWQRATFRLDSEIRRTT